MPTLPRTPPRAPPRTPSTKPAGATPEPTPQASWFGAPLDADTVPWAEPSMADTSFADSTQIQAGGQTPQGASGRISLTRGDGQRASFFRIYRAFLTARASLALVLLALVVGAWLLGNRPPTWLPVMTASYGLLTTVLWAWPSQRRPGMPERPSLSPRQAMATVGVDLIFFGLLHYLAGTALNSQALLVLPVLMAAVLMPRVMGLGVAAIATLNLLAAALLQGSEGNSINLLTQAGLTGFGLFAIAALASELSARLAKEERSARGSLELARQQAQLNRLVLEEMSEGVLVVDRQGRVRTANPAARRLLSAHGLMAAAPFQMRGVPAWQGLVKAVEQALSSPQKAEDGQEVKLQFDDQSQRELRLRVRFTRGKASRHGEDMCVMLLEDLRTVRARQRQDKLAAMGRMSAGIAHEIRNPLAAIDQANALMAEDAATATQKRLTQMVTENVARLKHIVDDILAVAPGVRPQAPAIDPIETVVAICNEWRSTHSLPGGDEGPLNVDTASCQRAPHYPHIKVRFEPEHLHRVLVNLLDNALRYNSGEPGAMAVSLRWMPSAEPAGMLMLSVSSDGEPISADTERSLFEPFFSTRSRGTGLGLYICRELCERHGAAIDYRLHPPPVRHRNEFFVTVPIEAAATSPYAA
jgi:two-component system sensor histidine kinase PilS (NtrC family)